MKLIQHKQHARTLRQDFVYPCIQCQKRRSVFASFCRFVSKTSIRVCQFLSILVENVDPCLPRQILSDRDDFYLFKIGRLNCTTFVLRQSVLKTSIRVKNVNPCFCVANQVDFGKFLRLFVRQKLGLISTTCNTLSNNYFAHKNHRSLRVSAVVSSAKARLVFGAA